MTLTSGSFPWLVAHDLRLSWRGFSALLENMSRPLAILLLAMAAIVLHLIAWPIARWISPIVMGPDARLPIVATLIVCTFTWMLAQALFGASRTLYARGDLDLLLSSPLPSRHIVAAKAIGLAAGTFGSISLLTLPLANSGAASDSLAWLGLYPMLISLALLATASGLALAILLFSLVGPRRARLWTQMTGALIAGTFVLGAQVAAVLPTATREGLVAWLHAGITEEAWGPLALLRLPIATLHGDTRSAAILLTLAIAAFAASTTLLANRFSSMSVAAAGAGADPGSSRRNGPVRFAQGLAPNMRRKEWRLLSRDPGLFAQLALQIIYTVPVAVVLLRNESLPPVFALAPTLVVIAAQVAASLAWITVSGEDAPELIATAPVTSTAVDRAKLNAVALPVFTVMAVPIAALFLVSWQGALITGTMAAAAAISTALLNFWHPMPGNRRGMLRRHSQSKAIALIEHGLALLWAIAVVLALLETMLYLVPVSLVAAVLLFFRK